MENPGLPSETVSIIRDMICQNILNLNSLSGLDKFVSGDKNLHQAPGGKVSNAADAEYDEVSRGLTFEAKKPHVSLGRVVKQNSRNRS